MSELTEKFRTEFQDEETRHIYADDFLNTFIATQLKVLREERGWTQQSLAERAEMRQERISVLEDVNYESWSVRTLKRLAKAFDLRLSIKFVRFGTFLTEFDEFNRESLTRPSFENDPAFSEEGIQAAAARLANANDLEMISSSVFSLPTTSTQGSVVQIADFRPSQLETSNEPSNRAKQLKRLASGG